jgi:hypothetical protein
MQAHPSPPPSNSPEALGKFISEQNIAHYRKCLTEMGEEKQRKILLKLLADELARKYHCASGRVR